MEMRRGIGSYGKKRKKKTDRVGEKAEALVPLATRIPKPLMKQLQVHCVTSEVTMMDFIGEAIAEKMQKEAE